MLKLIAAIGKNNELGKDNSLMWNLPGDMKFFRATTAGSCVIMGRKTFESIGRPLPKRRNIVISGNPELKIDGAEAVKSLEAAIALCMGDAFIIGGASIYEAALPMADEIILTEIDAEYSGADVFFPEFNKELYSKEILGEGCDNGVSYAHVRYSRISSDDISIERYTENRIDDVIKFEAELRRQEKDIYLWNIDEEYISSVKKSFNDKRFDNSVSLLAYAKGKVVGRIDSSLVPTRFDGSICAYLDWICVLKSYRHIGVAQKLLEALKSELKKQDAGLLIALMANNDEAQRFYKSIENTHIGDTGIRIDI